MNDLEKVEARITAVRAELTRLETARDVLAEIYGKDSLAKAGTAGKAANGHAGGTSGGFTLRRVADPALAKAGGSAASAPAKPQPIPKHVREKRKVVKAQVREKALAALRDAGPSSSGELFKRIKAKPDQKQLLYQVLYDLKKAGVLKHGVDGIYAIAPTAKFAKASAQEGATAH